jgi:hypothetical protein
MNLRSTLLAATMLVAAAGGLFLVLAETQAPVAAAPLALPEPGLGALLVAGVAATAFLAGRRRDPR